MSKPLSRRRFYIVDADYLLVYLGVPGFDRAGSDGAPIFHGDTVEKIDALKSGGETLVLPTSVIVEAGNHISNAKHQIRQHANAFATVIREALNSEKPWAAYDDTPGLDTKPFLDKLAREWAEEAEHGVSIGDMAVRHVASHYESLGSPVTILTGDERLAAYSSSAPEVAPPRRRKRRS